MFSTPSAPVSAGPGSVKCEWWEHAAVWVILFGFLGVELNNIHNYAFMGQDWKLHTTLTEWMSMTPDRWFYYNATFRPLVFWTARFCQWFTHGQSGSEMTALICVLSNLLALRVLHLVTLDLMRSPILRIATLALITFLPVTMITAVVYAGDTAALLPFALAAWGLMRSATAETLRKTALFALLSAFGMSLGQISKGTFVLMPFAVFYVAAVLKYTQRISWKQLGIIVGIAGLAPSVLAIWTDAVARRETAQELPRHRFQFRGPHYMDWSSLVGLKTSDLRVLSAPGYWDPSTDDDPIQPLLRDNNYSYLALLHLSLFTDVGDFANQGSKDNGAPRPQPQKKFSQWAVRGGLLFSIPCLAAVGIFIFQSLSGLYRFNRLPSTGALVWGSFGLCWALPIILVMPFVVAVYIEGYWTPRLIIPAVWSAFLILFHYVDRIFAERPKPFVWSVLILVLLQSAVQIRSVWY